MAGGTRADASSSHAHDVFAGFHDIVPVHAGLRSGVFHAREDGTERPVALKVLTIDGVTPAGLEAFARESAVLAALGAHPNIVTLYRSYQLPDGRPVLVLEQCGGSLGDWLREGNRPDPAHAVALTIKIAGALETAHRGGVLHRDVRPANVLITEFGEPALADFGVARLRSSVPAPAELFDFPSVHVAPELLLGNGATAATDVYGLASSLYEMVSGQPPLAAYEGESPAATILRILRDPARPIIREDVPIELSDLLLWALAKDPADRPPSAMWLAEELRRIEAHNGWPRTRALVREPEQPLPPPAGWRRMLRPRRPLGGGTAGRNPVLRAPLLSVAGRFLALVCPLWLAIAAVLAVTAPRLAVSAAAVAGGGLLTALASWYARPSLAVGGCQLRHRDGLRRLRIPWTAVASLQACFEPSRRPGAPHGLVVLESADGTVPLTATRCSTWQLADLVATLEAIRAEHAGHKCLLTPG